MLFRSPVCKLHVEGPALTCPGDQLCSQVIGQPQGFGQTKLFRVKPNWDGEYGSAWDGGEGVWSETYAGYRLNDLSNLET